MKVRLHIQTTTVDLSEEEAQAQSFSSSVVGELVEAEEEYLLTYKESELFEMGDTETEMHLSKKSKQASVWRKGDVNTVLLFDPSLPYTDCTYRLAFAAFSFHVVTRKLFYRIREGKGSVSFDYLIELQAQAAKRNRVSILLRPLEESEVEG